jgi:hypothetical protein
VARDQAARGAEAGECGGLAAQREGDERVVSCGENDAFTRPCGRDRLGPYRVREFAPAEELLDRRPERAGADSPFNRTVHAPQLDVSHPTGVPVLPTTSLR